MLGFRPPAAPRRYLCLVNGGYGPLPLEEQRRRERDDQTPRATYFGDTVGAEIVDELFLDAVWRPPGPLGRRLPYPARQLAVAWLLRNRYEALVLWGERLGLPLAALLKAHRSATPLVAMFSWVSKPPKPRLLAAVHSQLDRLIFWNRHQASVARGLGVPEHKVKLIHWGVDTQFFRPLPAVAPEGFCAVGSESRDYATLFAALEGNAVPVHVAAGTARLASGLSLGELPLPPRVTVGRKTFAELRQLYASSHFVVLPIDARSDTDNGITAATEAMAMGKPVVLSRTLANVDGLVEHGVNGLLVEPGSPGALREAIASLLADPERCRRMGAAGRQKVEKLHRLEDFVANVGAIVAEAVAEHGR